MFYYEILQECETEEEAKNVELSYLEDLTIRDKLYNLHYNSSGGDLMTYHPDREEIIEKIKNTIKENISKMSKEERQKKWGQSGEKNGMYGKTHTDEVKRLCSSVLMMKNGTIVDSGAPENLIKKHGRKNLEEVFLELVRNKNELN